MIPAPFEYEVAESSDHAVELLGRFGEDAKLLAGGHSLLPLMKLRLAQPSALVDIGRVSDLSYVREDGDAIAIGALTCHEDVHFDETLRQHCPLVAHAAGEVGDPQVRHLGTIGGSVAHGDPASDLPSVLLTLDAEFVVHGPQGDRTVGAGDFFKGLFEVDLSPQEILTEVRVPKLQGAGWSYQKFHARAQDWAVVGVAAVVKRSNGSIGSAQVGLTTMGETPLRATAVEQALASGADVAAAAQEADRDTSPPSDPMGSADYRKELVKVLTRRALEEAMSR
jgi:aerobic carbon-monoxide dehydrogenase medium subunit